MERNCVTVSKCALQKGEETEVSPAPAAEAAGVTKAVPSDETTVPPAAPAASDEVAEKPAVVDAAAAYEVQRTVSTTDIQSVAEWLACWTRSQKRPGSNRSRDAVA